MPDERREFQALMERIRGYLLQADPESLAGTIAHIPTTTPTAPEEQIPQWLSAFDAAAMATFRALALLATHPEHADQARQEIANRAGSFYLPYLRATVLESLRLWPTSPLVLRESKAVTEWETGDMPAGTAIVIFAPFFHRDDERLPFANEFSPQLWMESNVGHNWPLIPFSEGSAACPGRELVLLLSSEMLSALLADKQWELKRPMRIERGKPLPGTLNHFGLRFELEGF